MNSNPLTGHRLAIWKRAALIMALCGALALVAASDLLHTAIIDLLRELEVRIEAHPFSGAIMFVLFAALSAMLAFVSAAAVVPAAVYAWGQPLTIGLLLMGWVLGGLTAYALARLVGQPAVKFLVPAAALARLETRVKRNAPFTTVLLFQFALPSEVPAYVLGLIRYPLRKYLLALLIAELPYAIATTMLGESFIRRSIPALVAIGIGGAVFTLWAFRRLRHATASAAESPLNPGIRSMAVPSLRVGSFPWRPGNRFTLLNDGEQFYPAMLQAISSAQQCVLLEMYLVTSGKTTSQFIEALQRVAARGVCVAVLLDGFGALGLKREDREQLVAQGVQLRFYNRPRWRKRLRNFMRNHRKLLLVDGEVAFVGGAGLSDDFFNEPLTGKEWREVMVEVRGAVIADWQELFASSWYRSGGGRLPQIAASGIAGEALGRVIMSEGWHRAELAASVRRRIQSARQRVWITSPYFVPSRSFRKELRRAARRGVDVRLLASGPVTDHPLVRHAARRFFGKMLRNGVQILEFQPRMLHSKIVLCDDWTSIGSANLDRWGFKWNLEANQEIDDQAFAAAVAAVFEEDCRASSTLERRAWANRSWFDRMWERAAGALDRMLERWRRPRLL